jgi:Pentapeptide repeats (8 copies)
VIEYQRVVSHLKQNGYNEQDNIADSWFSNHEKFRRVVDQKFPNHSQIFDLQVRWRSAIGKACIEDLRSYIEQSKEQYLLEGSRRGQLGDFTFTWAKLDFNDFTFHFDGQIYNFESLANTFPTSQIGGWHDLRGIPLDGIHLTNSMLIGLNCSSASFIGSNFQQIKFHQCNFSFANFDNSRFVMIRHDEDTALGGISGFPHQNW